MLTLLNFLIFIGILSGTTIPTIWVPRLIAGRHKKRGAIRDYVRRLGRVLRVRYGLQESYSAAWVTHMMRKWGYSTAYDGYALALYCSRSEFESYYSNMAEPYDYDVTREEIRTYLPCFEGDFTAADVVALGDRLNAKGRALKRADDDIYDSSDLDSISSFISNNKGKDYGDNFKEKPKGSTAYGGGFVGFD
ncbi:MAG: DUF6559 family protein [Cyanobacteria bacterium J06627_28]